MMKKSDIRSGMILIFRNGNVGLVIETEIGLMVQLDAMFGVMDFVSNDLKAIGARTEHGFDIVEVRRVASPEHVVRRNMHTAPIVWSRAKEEWWVKLWRWIAQGKRIREGVRRYTPIEVECRSVRG